MADKKDTGGEAKKGSALMGLIKGVAFVAVLVVVEVVAAALIIPSPQDTEALARELTDAKAGEEESRADDGTSITEAQTRTEEPTREVELGSFNVTRFNPDSDRMINVDIELFATVLEAEELDFTDQFTANKNRVRDQINATLHAAEPGQLNDAGLGLIKRRILEKTNRALGKPLVREILVTRLNFVER